MLKSDEKSNAQCWELEVTCKNSKYFEAVVDSIVSFGNINFEVEVLNGSFDKNDKWEGRYTILIWSSWFSSLGKLSNELVRIEKEIESF